MTPRPPSDGPRLVLLQILRGIAAMGVLLGHTQGAILASGAAAGIRPGVVPHLPGGFGVDLFFTISGFVILVASASDAGMPAGRGRFLRKRIARLVPLYWLATLVFVPLLLASRAGPRGDLGTALVASLLFIPHPAVVGPDGAFPVYDLGWTLNFEMFFYALFALSLSRPLRSAGLRTAALLVAIVFAGFVLPAGGGAMRAVWTAPILLEFVFGLLIGIAFRSAFRLPKAISAASMLAGVAFLFLDPAGLAAAAPGTVTPNDLARVAGWGVPAALVLGGAVFLEKSARIPAVAPVRWMRAIGDASYALYLVHPLVLIAAGKLWDRSVPDAARRALTVWPVFGVLLVALALAAGLVVHRAVERKLTRAAGRLLQARHLVATPAVAS